MIKRRFLAVGHLAEFDHALADAGDPFHALASLVRVSRLAIPRDNVHIAGSEIHAGTGV
jgi:hypothetical protein